MESMMSLLFLRQHIVKNAQNLIKKSYHQRVHLVLECTVDALFGLRKKDADKCGISYLCVMLKGNMHRDSSYTEDSLKESMHRCAMMLWFLIKWCALRV
jgi:hypothetical protein